MSDDTQQTTQPQLPEVEREERRLERLRLVSQLSVMPRAFDDDDSEPPKAA
jgi:hypothetical protein